MLWELKPQLTCSRNLFSSSPKLSRVPDEGWFGQPKYSTPSKNIFLRCPGFCLEVVKGVSSTVHERKK